MSTLEALPVAPELTVQTWLNTDQDITLHSLRGKVVVIEAFQMLCPGCVSHGLPQAQTVQNQFPREQVVVIGLHTVFEHHDAMTPVALKAFLHEYRVSFPVAIDQPNGTGVPETMASYGMRGTPTLLIIDQLGRLRAHHFGQVSDMKLGAEIATVMAEVSAE